MTSLKGCSSSLAPEKYIEYYDAYRDIAFPTLENLMRRTDLTRQEINTIQSK